LSATALGQEGVGAAATTILERRFAARVATADWPALADELDAYGCALLPRLVSPSEAADLIALYDQPELFRATINMQRHQFGRGEYRYFKAPFPERSSNSVRSCTCGCWRSRASGTHGSVERPTGPTHSTNG
jgi:hypothetical protein